MSVGMFCCFQYALHQAVGPGVATSCGNDAYDFRAAHSSSAQRNLEYLGVLLQPEESSVAGMKAILFLTTHKYMPYVSPFGTL